MLMDGPVIDYGANKKKGMGNSKADVAEMDALSEAWMKKKESEGGSLAGKSVSLDGFLQG